MLSNKTRFIPALSVIFLLGCYNREANFKVERTPTLVKKERTISYRDMTVPEESGSKFVKFTDETDYVVGPEIIHETGVIRWYTGSFLTVSADDKQVAYIGRKSDKQNVFIKSTEGGRTTIQRTFRNNVAGAAYSKNGSYIAFTESVDNNYNIYQIAADKGVAVQQVTATSSYEASPTYSSDNQTIYYTKGEYDGNAPVGKRWRFYIWSYNTKTAISTQYTEGYSCTLSPDGNLLYVTRTNKENYNGEIWSINLDNGQETLILANDIIGYSTPQISPDGKKILCTGSTPITKERNENLDLYVVDTDGTNLTQLTFHPGDDVSPVWSRNGKKIYFLSQRGNDKGDFGVWMIEFKQ